MSPQYINVTFQLVEIGKRQIKKANGLLAHLPFLLFLYVRFQLNVQNAVSPQPCLRKLGISLVLLNFLGCNFGW